FIRQAAEHLTFLVLTDNLPRALTLFEKHLPWALDTTNPDRRFVFLTAAHLLFRRLEEMGTKEVTLRLPRDFARFSESGRYAKSDLSAWCDAETQELAAQFDARNGNDYCSQRRAENLRLLERTTPSPFAPPRKAKK